MAKLSLHMLDIYQGLFCLEKWITNPLIQVMREIDTQTNEPW